MDLNRPTPCPPVRLLLLLLLALGCGDSSQANLEVSVQDSAGIKIIENLVDPAAVPLYAELDPTPIAEIGVVSGNTDQEFGRISDASLLTQDRILVADGQARELRLFDFSGSLVWRRGRQGGGPGEFGSFGAVQLTAGDSIRVFDPSNRRLVVLHPGSETFRTVPFQEIRKMRPQTVAFLPDGRVIVSVSTGGGSSPLSSEFTRTRDSVALLLTDEEGVELASFGAFLRIESMGKASREGSILRTLHATLPFTRFTEWVSTPTGIVVGTSDRFQFKVFDLRGHLLRIFRAPGFEEPLTGEMISAQKELMVERGGGGPDAQRQADEFFFPEFQPPMKPAFRGLAYDSSGFVWVGEYQVRPELRETWFVFRETGELLGRVVLPSGSEIHSIREDLILLQPTHELDVPVLRVHRLIKEVLHYEASGVKERPRRPQGLRGRVHALGRDRWLRVRACRPCRQGAERCPNAAVMGRRPEGEVQRRFLGE